jgi:iron complex transport system permease protein
MSGRRNFSFPLYMSIVLLVVTLLASLSLGGAPAYPWDLFTSSGEREVEKHILLSIRLPRILAACLVGGALGAAGALSQGIFRNSLASPSILGVSSGGVLFVTFSIFFGFSDTHPWLTPALAFLGALSSLLILLRFAHSKSHYSIEELLLIGFALTSIYSAIGSLLLSMSLLEGDRGTSLMNWMLGTLVGKTWLDSLWALPVFCIGVFLAFRLSYQLNLFSLGIEHAQSLGLNIKNLRSTCFVAISLLVATSVALGGMLPFVGLIVPHLSRLIVGPNHQILIPFSILNGMILVNLADLFARIVIQPIEIQVGVLISILGSPFFLWLLLRERTSVK